LNSAAGVAVDVARFQGLAAQGDLLRREDQLAAAAYGY
jgi:hypothetical protein